MTTCRGIVLLSLAVVLAACGGGSSTKKTTTTTAKESASGQKGALVDVVTCDNASGKGTASGTVQNPGSKATGYHMKIGFYDRSTNKLLGSGTADTAAIQPGATGDWKVSATGMGTAEIVCHTLTIDALADGASGTTATTSGSAASEFPCNLLTQSQVEQITANPLDPGDASTNHVTQDSASWTARECAWAKPSAANATEVTLGVSRAGDFGSGSVECPPLPGSTTPVSGLGTEAHWSWTDTGTATTVGELRVCTSAALVDVHVSGSVTGDAHLAVARGVAEQALAAL